VHGKNIKVLIDRVKPAYLFIESLTDAGETINNQWQHNQTQSTTQVRSQDNERVTDQEQNKSSPIPGQIG